MTDRISTDELRKLLAKATPGPWDCHYGRDDCECECKSVVGEHGGFGAICMIEVDNGLPISNGGNDAPNETQAKPNARLIAAAPDLAAEVIQLREVNAKFRQSIDAVMKHIPMSYLQRHDVPGATGPTSGLVIDAAMRDYAEDRWNLIDRFRQEKADNERLREALSEIWLRHIPDQPASYGWSERDWVVSQYTELRRIARAAINHKETDNGPS